MKMSEFIEKLETLFREFEHDQDVIIDDISLDVKSIMTDCFKEQVIYHGIKLKVRAS
jgi:hypothetical protein